MKKMKYAVLWATLSITIPNSVVNRSTTAFCGTWDYASHHQPDETPIQFTQRMIVLLIKQTVVSFERQQASQSAGQTQEAQTAADVAGIQ